MKFSDIHEQILITMKSNTLSALTDEQIAGYLDLMLIRAIADFRFPQMSLSYLKSKDGDITEYTFDNKITQREINVLIVLVKKFWLEQQIDNETFFEETYYDRDVKMYSRSNLLRTLQSRYELAIREGRIAQYNYSRVNTSGKEAVGDIYGL